MLEQSHIRLLTNYVRELQVRHGVYVPNFDPLDGGVGAKLLFLLEKPGPKTFPPVGSGFISCNNNDPSARTMHRFLAEAEIPRKGIVLWNTIPWWNGTMAMTNAEKRSGAAEISSLLARMPKLKGVVLVGNLAAEFGAPQLMNTGLKIFCCVHPSMQSRNGLHSRERWLQLPKIWREAWQAVT